MTQEQQLAKNTLKLIKSFFGDNIGDFEKWEYYNGKNAGKDILETKKLAQKILNRKKES